MRERTSMRRIREALRLVYQQGMSRNQAARALNIGSSTLKDLLKRFQSSGLPLEAALQLGDTDLEEHLFARPNQRGSRVVAEPDMDHVASELKRPGVTLKLLWEEYRKVHPTGIGYTQFCDRHNKHRGGQDLVMRQTTTTRRKGDGRLQRRSSVGGGSPDRRGSLQGAVRDGLGGEQFCFRRGPGESEIVRLDDGPCTGLRVQRLCSIDDRA